MRARSGARRRPSPSQAAIPQCGSSMSFGRKGKLPSIGRPARAFPMERWPRSLLAYSSGASGTEQTAGSRDSLAGTNKESASQPRSRRLDPRDLDQHTADLVGHMQRWGFANIRRAPPQIAGKRSDECQACWDSATALSLGSHWQSQPATRPRIRRARFIFRSR